MNQFQIDLKALKEGMNDLALTVDDDFFRRFPESGLEHGSLRCDLSIQRIDEVFEMKFHTVGEVTVSCDLCLDDMQQPIDTEDELMCRLGDEDSEDEDFVTVERENATLDVARFIKEFIILAIPIRHVHAPGKCNASMMNLIEQYSVSRRDVGDDEPVDPRWAALKKLKH